MSCALGVNLFKNIFWTKWGNQSCGAWLWSNLRKWKCWSFWLFVNFSLHENPLKDRFWSKRGESSELQDLKKLKEVKFVNFVSFPLGENVLKNIFWPKKRMIRFVMKIYILISSSRAETAPPGAASDLYIYTCASLAQVAPIRCFALWENFFSFEICCLHYILPMSIFWFLKIFLHNQSNDQNVIRRDEEISLVFVTKKWRH